MELLWSTFAFGLGSALLPLLNIEIYLGAIGTQTSTAAVLGLALAASAGQTLGKIVWYVVARRSIDSTWMQAKLDKRKVRETFDRWEERSNGRPWYAAGILFASASIGVPPLLVMAVIAGSLHMRFWIFVLSCFVGRTLRFYFLLAGVAFFTQ